VLRAPPCGLASLISNPLCGLRTKRPRLYARFSSSAASYSSSCKSLSTNTSSTLSSLSYASMRAQRSCAKTWLLWYKPATCHNQAKATLGVDDGLARDSSQDLFAVPVAFAVSTRADTVRGCDRWPDEMRLFDLQPLDHGLSSNRFVSPPLPVIGAAPHAAAVASMASPTCD
jgi:hypothetical protein